MSEFINTIDELGDETVLSMITDGTITEFKDNVITSLKTCAFSYCDLLETVDLPNVTSVGSAAFYNCKSLKSVNLPNVSTIISGYENQKFVFGYCDSLESIYLPKLTTVTDQMFSYCKSLKSVNLPNANNKINNNAFYYCTSLESIDLPKATTIGDYAFYCCDKLTQVNLPNVTTINQYAFYYCDSLKLLDLPKATTINSNGLSYTRALTALILRSSTLCKLSSTNSLSSSSVGNGAGYIYVPRNLIDSYKTATNWSAYASQFRILEDYTVDGTIDGKLDESKLKVPQTTVLAGRVITDVSSEDITTIGYGAFAYCTILKNVNLPNVTSVGSEAFRDTSIESITFKNSVSLSGWALSNVSKLKKIDLGGISSTAFYSINATNLETFIIRSNTLCPLSGSADIQLPSTAYIYVPSALVLSYKTATNWSAYKDQFRAIEDYPEICGGDN
jgi:hypothetical protein